MQAPIGVQCMCVCANNRTSSLIAAGEVRGSLGIAGCMEMARPRIELTRTCVHRAHAAGGYSGRPAHEGGGGGS